MERFRPPHGDLFQKGDVNQLEDALKESVRKRIHDLKDDYILNVSEQEYINYLADDFHLDCYGQHAFQQTANPVNCLFYNVV